MYGDLQEPEKALRRDGRSVRQSISRKPFRYKLYSLVKSGQISSLRLSDFVVRMENFGVPQARHRIIILGIREDIDIIPNILEPNTSFVPVKKVLYGLPRVRSGLSCEEDNADFWISRLDEMTKSPWYRSLKENESSKIYEKLAYSRKKIRRPRADRGGEFIKYDPKIDYCSEWFLDPRIEGVCNHSTRTHIVNDLYRYFYTACFAQAEHRSALLRDFLLICSRITRMSR